MWVGCCKFCCCWWWVFAYVLWVCFVFRVDFDIGFACLESMGDGGGADAYCLGWVLLVVI